MSDFTEEKDTGYTLARYLGFGTLAYGGFKFATTFDRGIFGRSKEVVDISQKITNTIVPFARLKAPLQSVTPDISDLEPLHRAYIEQGTQLKFGSSLNEALNLPEGRSYVNRLMNQAPSFLEQMPSDVLSSGLST